jgi:hypothetical protein
MYGLGEKETMVLYIQIVIPCLMYGIDKRHGLFAPIPNMLTMDHYISLYSIMVSSHQFHT